jgi:hypothetical protein
MLPTKEIREKLKDRITLNEYTGCWEWQGALNWSGYGIVLIGKKRWLVHRLMYSLFKIDIPLNAGHNLQITHSCDNPCCVNPEHLRMGTAKDNVKDCYVRSRAGNPPQLTKKEAEEIIDLDKSQIYTRRELAILYDVSIAVITRAINKKNTYYKLK